MHTKFLICLFSVGLAVLLSSSIRFQENEAPVVTIESPEETTQFAWDSYVPFKISVTDHEDGNSAYDEIPPQEVVLTVSYFTDSIQAKNRSVDARSENLNALAWLASSNCFTCHNAKDKLIGPSFSQIAERYAGQVGAVEYLAEKVTEGTTGTWGNQIMPAQPELSTDALRKTLRWILNNSGRPDFNFLTGIEGAFKTPATIGSIGESAICVVTVAYTDHGVENVPESAKMGVDSVWIRAK